MDFTQAISLIKQAKNILLTTHIRPDGDAIGSLIALEQVINRQAQQENKTCHTTILTLSKIPDIYSFLLTPPNIATNPTETLPAHPQRPPATITGKDIAAEMVQTGQLDKYDLIIIADTSAARQLPNIGDYLIKRTQQAQQTDTNHVLVLDHHLSGDNIGSCRIIDTRAAANGEIVYQLCQAANWKLSTRAAQALFTAISTDTGWFRFENTTAQTLNIASQLTQAGAKPHVLYQKLYQNDPPQRLALLALTLQTLELHCDNRLAIMHITKEMLKQTGADYEHIENIVNTPQSIATVIAVALLVEQKDGTTRCSFRSKTPVDVNQVAARFNGGGHARAAGATLNVPLLQAKKQIMQALSEYINS